MLLTDEECTPSAVRRVVLAVLANMYTRADALTAKNCNRSCWACDTCKAVIAELALRFSVETGWQVTMPSTFTQVHVHNRLAGTALSVKLKSKEEIQNERQQAGGLSASK